MLANKNILIEVSPGIGDLVMCTPSFRRIKEMYPSVHLSVASYGVKSLDSISRLPYIDHVYGLNNSFRGRLKAVSMLCGQDYVFFNSYQPMISKIAWALRIPNISGNAKNGYINERIFTAKLPYTDEIHTVFQAEYFANKLSKALSVNLCIDNRCDVSLPSISEEQEVSAVFEQLNKNPTKGYIVISPFGNSGLSFSGDLIFELLIGLLNKYDYDIVISNNKENILVKEILDEINSSRIYDISGKTSLIQLIAVLKNAKLLVTPDSGPLHMACAVETKVVPIFSYTSPKVWCPRDYAEPIYLNMKCSPCTRPHDCKDKKCINEVSGMDLQSKCNSS